MRWLLLVHCGGIDRLPTASGGGVAESYGFGVRADRQARFCNRRRRQESWPTQSVEAGGKPCSSALTQVVGMCLLVDQNESLVWALNSHPDQSCKAAGYSPQLNVIYIKLHVTERS